MVYFAHGFTKGTALEKKTYAAWNNMKQRCFNPRCSEWHRYGGRGITVCDRWLVFVNFFSDMGLPPSSEHSLDRYPDNNGIYEPTNCRWATLKQQHANMRFRKPWCRIVASPEVMALHAKGMTTYAIARWVGVSQSSVQRIISSKRDEQA